MVYLIVFFNVYDRVQSKCVINWK